MPLTRTPRSSDGKFSNSNGNLRREGNELIDELNYGNISREFVGTINSGKNVRLDSQGSFTDGGLRFIRLALQLGGSGITTIAQVEICLASVASGIIAKQAEALEIVKNEFKKSLKDGQIIKVTGAV